jgi:hypothetical protein
VVKTADVLGFLDGLPKGMFALPKGVPVSPPRRGPKLAASL